MQSLLDAGGTAVSTTLSVGRDQVYALMTFLSDLTRATVTGALLTRGGWDSTWESADTSAQRLPSAERSASFSEEKEEWREVFSITPGIRSPPPEDYSPWLGHWVQVRYEEEIFNEALAKQGFPYPLRQLMKNFIAERKFSVDDKGKFLLTSKMLGFDVIKKFWNSCYVDDPTTFSVLGYTIVATLGWEDGGTTFASTTVTTAADGLFLKGWTATTRMTHRITDDGELEVTTISPDASYKNWFRKLSDEEAAKEALRDR